MAREDFAQQESEGLSGFALLVDHSYWQIDEKYAEKLRAEGRQGNDAYFLNWTGRTNLPDRPLMGPADFHPKWAADPDFVSMDGGATVVSQSGNKSKLGKAVGRMMGIASKATGHLAGTPQDFMELNDHRVAASWNGTCWLMETVERDWGGRIGKTNELMPVKFLGFGEAALQAAMASPPQATAAPAPAAAPVAPVQPPLAPVAPPVAAPVAPVAPVAAAPAAVPPAAPPAPPAVAQAVPQANGAVGDALRGQLEDLARAHTDYRTFQTAALSIPGLSDRPDLLVTIADPNGIFAQVAR